MPDYHIGNVIEYEFFIKIYKEFKKLKIPFRFKVLRYNKLNINY